MALKAQKIGRVFLYNGVKLPDPAPGQTVEQCRDILALTYPEIATAALEGPELVAGSMRYTFERSVGTKG